MIQTLSDKLLSLFSAYQGVGKPFVQVLDYHTLESTGYPYLTFEPIGFDAIVLDTCNNQRTYNFQILIFQEITETGGRKEAKEIISKGISDIKSIIDENYTLDGTISMMQPVGGTITPVELNSGKGFVADLTVAIKVIEFIY